MIMVKYMVYTENVTNTINHYMNTTFHDEGDNKAIYSKPEPDLTQCAYLKTILFIGTF